MKIIVNHGGLEMYEYESSVVPRVGEKIAVDETEKHSHITYQVTGVAHAVTSDKSGLGDALQEIVVSAAIVSGGSDW